jgi:hypothetical protein
MPSIADIASIIAALAALSGVLLAWHNRSSIQNLHIDIDGRMGQLLEATGAAREALGVAKERQETRGRSVSEAEDAAKVRALDATEQPPQK